MFNQNLNGWYNHFCNDCDNLQDVSEIISNAVSLSYRSSIQHALWKDGKHVGFDGMIREKNMAKAECEIYLSAFLNEVIHMTDENALFERIQQAWDDIRTIYHNNGITWYTYGNAQKWTAMSIKYCFVIAYRNNMLDRSHIFLKICFPVDRIMMNSVVNDFGLAGVSPTWSQCDDKQQFIDYITNLKSIVNARNEDLLEYEIKKWETN